MYHSLIISGKNTYDEWGLVPTSRPVVAMPEVKETYVELLGSHGVLDYTTLLLGEPPMGQRKGSWEFMCKPGTAWVDVQDGLANFLHGERKTVVLEDDPDHIYVGRLKLNAWKSEPEKSIITIDYNLDPFKFNTEDSSGTTWSWNSLFTEVIRTRNFTVSGSASGNVKNRGQKAAIPTLTCSAAITVTIGTQSFGLVSGKNYNTDIILQPGDNSVSFSGSATVKLEYREASI